jgi:hypothetical protein
MTAHPINVYEGRYFETYRWFVKAQFTNNSWVEYTSGPYGSYNDFLSIEQLYGYCLDVYCIYELWTLFKRAPVDLVDSSTSSLYHICYGEEP